MAIPAKISFNAEDQGFEPWKVLPLFVFKTNAISLSANLPGARYENRTRLA